MSGTGERTFGLSIHSKIIMWFLVLFVSGALGLLLYIISSYVRDWKEIDSRALFALPVLLLGWLGATQIRYLLTKGPLLRISSAGIEDHVSGFGFVPWDDLVGVVATVTQIRGGVYKTLFLRVRNTDEYYERVPWLVRPTIPLRWFRRDSLPISFSYLDGPMEDALESIRGWRPDIPIEGPSD